MYTSKSGRSVDVGLHRSEIVVKIGRNTNIPAALNVAGTHSALAVHCMFVPVDADRHRCTLRCLTLFSPDVHKLNATFGCTNLMRLSDAQFNATFRCESPSPSPCAGHRRRLKRSARACLCASHRRRCASVVEVSTP